MKTLVATQLRRRILSIGRESWALFIAISLANLSNYAFHVLISRRLGPQDYSALSAVLAIMLVLSVPFTAVQTTVTKRLASLRAKLSTDELDDVWAGMLRAALPPVIGLTLLLSLASPILTSLLSLDSTLTALVVAVHLIPAVILSVFRGVFQAKLRFKRLAFLHVVPFLIRLISGVAIVDAGGGVPGATAATLLADCTGLILAFYLLGKSPRLLRRERARTASFLREAAPSLIALAAMWLFIGLDVVLARRFLPHDVAGEYAAAAMLARAVLFVPAGVSLVALPRFSEHRGRGREAHEWLVSASGLVLGLGGIGALGLSLFAPTVVELTYGSSFAGAASLLPTLSVAMVGVALTNLLLFFHIAAGSRIYHFLWFAAGAEIALTPLLLLGSSHRLALIVLAMAWTVTAVFLLSARGVARYTAPLAQLPTDVLMHPQLAHPSTEPDLSLVVPCHNGGVGVSQSIRAITNLLNELDRSHEVIVVSDGSNDGCERALADSNLPFTTVLSYGRRRGKGTALRVGMSRARGRYVAFIDCDGELDASHLKNFLAIVDIYDPDVVIGSKRHPLSLVSYPSSRRAMSWMYQQLIRILFGLNVRDTQTGMKVIRRDVLDAVLPRMLEKRFAFDLEFLVVARRLGHKRFFEAPITLDYKFNSTVSPRAAWRVLLDTAAIFYRTYVVCHYDHPPPIVAPPLPERAYQTAVLEATAEPARGP